MTRYAVVLTDDAKADLQDIYDYVADHDAPLKADQLLEKLEKLVESLKSFPGRGAATKELRDLGIREYREIYFKPYRVIYRTTGKTVAVYLIVDGRRDMQSLLLRRLAGA